MDRTTRIARLLLASRRVAKTLYHGTIVDNEESIRKIGLIGGVGSFVENAYGEYLEEGEDIPDLVFAADKKDLDNAVTAMVHHIGIKLGKSLHEVTDNDILNHGLLVVIHDEEDSVEQRHLDSKVFKGFQDYEDYKEYPPHVEPGDYYAESLGGDKFVKGRALLRLLKRYNQWPRNWGPGNPARLKQMRGWLITRALQSNPDADKQKIMNWVQSLPEKKVDQLFSQHRR